MKNEWKKGVNYRQQIGMNCLRVMCPEPKLTKLKTGKTQRDYFINSRHVSFAEPCPKPIACSQSFIFIAG